jgi:hypothetical protein
MKLLIRKFSPPSFYFLPHRLKYLAYYHILKCYWPMFSP